MICPHCNANLRYKERYSSTCSHCKKIFAFEPKKHPLLLTDRLFLATVGKLSNQGKINFTPQQFQYALSRKKMKPMSRAEIIISLVAGIFFSIVLPSIFFPLIFVVILGWIIAFAWWIRSRIKKRINLTLPQTPQEFNETVLNHWQKTYGEIPKQLITGDVLNRLDDGYRKILISQTQDTADFLIANKVGKMTGSAVLTGNSLDFIQQNPNLPVYVLHDASIEGINFYLQIKNRFQGRARVFDAGLLPRLVIKKKSQTLRKRISTPVNFQNLTGEENRWLNEGFYVPLSFLKPQFLIGFVIRQLNEKSAKTKERNVEKRAQAIGFMTWVGE